MRNLLKLANEATVKNTTKKSKNINQRLLEVLKPNVKMTREALKIEIAVLRMLEEKPFKNELLTEAKAEKLFESDNTEFKDYFSQLAKTVKNGLDTSISHSNNNSSFHFNPIYSNYSLEVNTKQEYYINKIK